jgi:hypothetical protein
MNRYAGRAALFLILFASTAYPAYSCTCAPLPQRRVFRASKSVFLGEFVGSLSSSDKDYSEAVRFKVIKQWKGKKSPEQVLLRGIDLPNMCGDLLFEAGERYLIYAEREKQSLIVHGDCSRSVHVKDAEEDIKKLDSLFYRLSYRLYPF